MQVIPYEEWERKEHCEFYNYVDIPFYSFTASIDLTNFMQYCKKEDIPFYYGMIYATVTVMNRLEDFRYRLRGDKVILHDKLEPSFTDMMEGSRLHKICKCPLEGTLKEFAYKAKQAAKEQVHFFPSSEEESRDDYVYITSMPWLNYTSGDNTLSLNKEDFIPRVSWGKYAEEEGKILMPYSVQVNHRAIDGIHIGELYQNLQEYLDILR